MTDEEIIELFFSRSEQAISHTAHKYGAYVKALGMNILDSSSDAEECVNDTWLALWNSIPPERPQSLISYICRVARNIAIDRYRANTAKKRDSRYDAVLDELEKYIPSPDGVEDAFFVRQLGAAINSFLATCSYDDRFLFIRRYWYADEISKAAEMAHMSYNQASVRLHRLRGRLKEYLKREGIHV